MKIKNLKKAALDFIFSSANEKRDESSTLNLRSSEYLNGYDVVVRATALVLSLPIIFGLLMLILKSI